MANLTKKKIVEDAVRRFQHLPSRTIARHIIATHGPLFDNNLERVRDRVRYVRGRHGDVHRDVNKDKSLFQTGPVEMPRTWRTERDTYVLPAGLGLVLSDVHIPFHEPVALEQAVRYGQAEKVEWVLLNGDMWDEAALGFWATAKRDFNAELEMMVDFLDWLRQEFPTQKIVYKPGNHEYRLPRYMMSHAPELAESPLAQVETVLGLEERDVEFLDFYQIVMAGKLPILHGHEIRHISRAVNPARGLFLRAKSFAAISHCHTTSEHPSRNIKGELLTCWSFGCACDLSPDWNPFCNDWNWGFALVNIEKDGDFEVVNKRILPNGDVR